MFAVSLSSLILLGWGSSYAESTRASWYSTESCKKEGTSGITASGEPLSNAGLTCATWDYPIHTRLHVRHGKRLCTVRVNDRGPGKKALSRGVTLDLSKMAFSQLAELKEGVIVVEVNPTGKEETNVKH